MIEGRLGREAGGDLDEFVVDVGLEAEPVTVRVARQAYRAYGRGNHPAGLNFGDCFCLCSGQDHRAAVAVQG